jgi:oligopeptide/dipeptide ABC transporter ATP-binding protein
MLNSDEILQVDGLETHFFTDDGVVKAVNDVSFSVRQGETVGIVGESGCGKSITSLSIMNMIPPPGKIVGGQVDFRRRDGEVLTITDYSSKSKEVRSIRGRDIAMIFQEPMTSFTPVYSIGRQIQESIMTHMELNKKDAKERAIELLDYVGIAAPRQRFDEFPHQFSGGMRQRAMIAMALACDPLLLIADEPTTALDVTIEAQILKLLRDIQEERGMSIMLITHDLSVIGEMADRVLVMYMGKLVERASCDDIFYSASRHPYTEGLLESIPRIGRREALSTIRGSTPNVYAIPPGCPFHPRCPYVMDVCKGEEPRLFEIEADHRAACYLYDPELPDEAKSTSDEERANA